MIPGIMDGRSDGQKGRKVVTEVEVLFFLFVDLDLDTVTAVGKYYQRLVIAYLSAHVWHGGRVRIRVRSLRSQGPSSQRP